MPAQRYRWIGETPVIIPDLNWGDPDHPVLPGQVSAPFEGEINNEALVVVGSPEDMAWVSAHQVKPPVEVV
jgi:hypothetical protein